MSTFFFLSLSLPFLYYAFRTGCLACIKQLAVVCSMTTKGKKKRKEQRAEESTERNGEKNAYIRSRNSYREEKNKAERAYRTTVNVRGNRAEMGHTKKLESHSTIDD